jgi:hypothetical protein
MVFETLSPKGRMVPGKNEQVATLICLILCELFSGPEFTLFKKPVPVKQAWISFFTAKDEQLFVGG